ncbi:hypothetical protein AB0G00_06770 [Nocardia salmonicida]|uniref:hypothetical protein n=1 Tax=Nocardia TaxID=1817 RepID=UPI00265AC928|nr:hypothetical protein [Nocardia sp. PE-7]WKG10358.1 hypothetical protein QX204_02325 [Nocardia sp. PE-7]
MTEDQVQQRKNLFMGGFAALGGVGLFILLFSAFGVEPSGLTGAITTGLLVAAAGCFGSAARIKRDARRDS